jgi:pyruvate/2-oxoglutarate dehydrogenase complex dihydrolipoamide acyltransferase (E2) component
MELPSPVTGTVLELLVDKGDDVHTGDPICVIDA